MGKVPLSSPSDHNCYDNSVRNDHCQGHKTGRNEPYHGMEDKG